MNITDATETLVRSEILRVLASFESDSIQGVSCLAKGADTIFAEAILEIGRTLRVVLPSATYRERVVKQELRSRFDYLLSAANDVYVLPYEEPSREAYQAANEKLLTECDILFAVWDGEHADGRGGTASTVQLARERGVPVEVIWPAGASRA